MAVGFDPMNERFRHARKFIENVLARDTNLSVFPGARPSGRFNVRKSNGVEESGRRDGLEGEAA
jgi:hypothetical protein